MQGERIASCEVQGTNEGPIISQELIYPINIDDPVCGS